MPVERRAMLIDGRVMVVKRARLTLDEATMPFDDRPLDVDDLPPAVKGTASAPGDRIHAARRLHRALAVAGNGAPGQRYAP